jgi:rod shape-determining protein MreD
MHISFVKFLSLYLIAILFTIFNLSSAQSAAMPAFVPLFDVMIIYYFAVYRNGIFSFWFLFLLGLWSDALSGLPLGITSFCYLLVVKFFHILNQRFSLRENFRQIFEQFIGFIFALLILKWLLLSLYNGAFYSLSPILAQMILTSVLYIIMHKFFDYLSRKLIDA